VKLNYINKRCGVKRAIMVRYFKYQPLVRYFKHQPLVRYFKYQPLVRYFND
jgi:hypothetical protein